MFRLVVVEDEELLRMGLTTFIDWQELGYELVGEAGDGKKGLEVIREARPDVIITDIKMPHMDGIEMTEILKKEMPELRIIIISGYDEFEYAKRALQAGVSEYILKPINMNQLKETVCKVRDELEEHRKHQAEYLELKNSRQENIRIKCRQLYEKILLNKCDLEDIAAEREQLSDHIEDQYYSAGLLAIQNFSILYMDGDYSLMLEKDYELGELVDDCLKNCFTDEERSSMELLRASHGERLLCISNEKREEVSRLINKIESYIKEHQENLEQLEATFGQITRNLEGLVASYRNVRKKSEQKFVRAWQESASTSSSADNAVQFMNYDTSNLCFEIKNGSQSSMEQCLQELKDDLSRQNITSYLQLVLIISNIYYALIRIPEEAGGAITDVIGDPQLYYQKLIGKMKRDDMIEELKDFCTKLHQYFVNLSMNRKQEVMRRIDAYLAEHFAQESLSMKEVADYAYVSVSYLGMIIRKETGKTFTEYLTDIRMEKARGYLANTNMKNYEVAEACGYSTPAYFSTVFKGVYGITPSEYRSSLKTDTVKNFERKY